MANINRKVKDQLLWNLCYIVKHMYLTGKVMYDQVEIEQNKLNNKTQAPVNYSSNENN